MDRHPEKNESLWLLTAAPAAWMVHFLACYATASIWCAKFAGPTRSLAGARTAIAVYTAIALLGIGITGWIRYRRHGAAMTTREHDLDTSSDRRKFMGFATLLLASLSAVATVYVALAAVFIETCY